MEPISPFFIKELISSILPEELIWFICPIFSSSVIFESKLSILSSVALSLSFRTEVHAAKADNSKQAEINFNDFILLSITGYLTWKGMFAVETNPVLSSI